MYTSMLLEITDYLNNLRSSLFRPQVFQDITPGAMKVTRLLRKLADEMPKDKPISSDPWHYYVGSPSPFWDRVRRALVNNPDSVSGITKQDHRSPTPGGRPELYARAASKASDIAQNPYYLRDYRRSYPRTSVITQPELAGLLIAQADQLKLPSPARPTASESPTSDTALTLGHSTSLASLYVPSDASSFKAPSGRTFSATFLPPKPPVVGIKHEMKLSSTQPACVAAWDDTYTVRYFT